MNLPLILFFLCCIGVGAARRTPLYDSFAEGAKEGLQTALSILPSLIAMLCAIRAFLGGHSQGNGALDADQAPERVGFPGPAQGDPAYLRAGQPGGHGGQRDDGQQRNGVLHLLRVPGRGRREKIPPHYPLRLARLARRVRCREFSG